MLDVDPPNIVPPTNAGTFSYTVPSNDLSAVGAYYHSDDVFRMVEEFGFVMGDHFDGTDFPMPADHRSNMGCESKCPGGDCVNAMASGNAIGDGSDGFR